MSRKYLYLMFKVKGMILSCWIFGSQLRFRICNSKLRVGRKSGKLYTQRILVELVDFSVLF